MRLLARFNRSKQNEKSEKLLETKRKISNEFFLDTEQIFLNFLDVSQRTTVI